VSFLFVLFLSVRTDGIVVGSHALHR